MVRLPAIDLFEALESPDASWPARDFPRWTRGLPGAVPSWLGDYRRGYPPQRSEDDHPKRPIDTGVSRRFLGSPGSAGAESENVIAFPGDHALRVRWKPLG
jgi:hypothetical protein